MIESVYNPHSGAYDHFSHGDPACAWRKMSNFSSLSVQQSDVFQFWIIRQCRRIRICCCGCCSCSCPLHVTRGWWWRCCRRICHVSPYFWRGCIQKWTRIFRSDHFKMTSQFLFKKDKWDFIFFCLCKSSNSKLNVNFQTGFNVLFTWMVVMSQIFEVKLSRAFSVKKCSGASRAGLASSFDEPNNFELSQIFLKSYVYKSTL